MGLPLGRRWRMHLFGASVTAPRRRPTSTLSSTPKTRSRMQLASSLRPRRNPNHPSRPHKPTRQHHWRSQHSLCPSSSHHQSPPRQYTASKKTTTTTTRVRSIRAHPRSPARRCPGRSRPPRPTTIRHLNSAAPPVPSPRPVPSSTLRHVPSSMRSLRLLSMRPPTRVRPQLLPRGLPQLTGQARAPRY